MYYLQSFYSTVLITLMLKGFPQFDMDVFSFRVNYVIMSLLMSYLMTLLLISIILEAFATARKNESSRYSWMGDVVHEQIHKLLSIFKKQDSDMK